MKYSGGPASWHIVLRACLLTAVTHACVAGNCVWLPSSCKVEITEDSRTHTGLVQREPSRAALEGVVSPHVCCPCALEIWGPVTLANISLTCRDQLLCTRNGERNTARCSRWAALMLAAAVICHFAADPQYQAILVMLSDSFGFCAVLLRCTASGGHQ